jgi:hypothetical protein
VAQLGAVLGVVDDQDVGHAAEPRRWLGRRGRPRRRG